MGDESQARRKAKNIPGHQKMMGEMVASGHTSPCLFSITQTQVAREIFIRMCVRRLVMYKSLTELGRSSSKNSKHTKSCTIPLSNKKSKTPWRNGSLQATMGHLHVSLGALEVVECSK